MDNFFNYITKPISPEDVDKWFRGNNIIPEKIELYFDFSQSLYKLMTETYLGYDNSHNETKIALSENDNDNQTSSSSSTSWFTRSVAGSA